MTFTKEKNCTIAPPPDNRKKKLVISKTTYQYILLPIRIQHQTDTPKQGLTAMSRASWSEIIEIRSKSAITKVLSMQVVSLSHQSHPKQRTKSHLPLFPRTRNNLTRRDSIRPPLRSHVDITFETLPRAHLARMPSARARKKDIARGGEIGEKRALAGLSAGVIRDAMQLPRDKTITARMSLARSRPSYCPSYCTCTPVNRLSFAIVYGSLISRASNGLFKNERARASGFAYNERNLRASLRAFRAARASI